MAFGVMAMAQTPFDAAVNNEDEVVHLERWQHRAAQPRQAIVKLQDYSQYTIVAHMSAKGTPSTRNTLNTLNTQNTPNTQSRVPSATIQAVLDSFEVAGVEQLCPDFVMPREPRRSASYGGSEVRDHDLSQLYLITLSEESAHNEYELIERLAALQEVEYAEPNYLAFALGNPQSDIISQPERKELSEASLGSFSSDCAINVADATYCASNDLLDPACKASRRKSGATAPNDPMYNMQWGLGACYIDSLLTAPKRDTAWRPIIAIIDTGVDIDHPDLSANIWTNPAEENGAAGQDDDGNGFKDDIHGWDFVNQTGDIHDFNSHGTHCAGIAGAVSNNGIGIAGACPDALIMPVAVMQSDGTGDIATIVRGINYAAQNGADVISMSIGSAAHSIAMEQALAVAYQTAVIVAAAGNDHYHIQRQICKEDPCVPMFPGAFSFVLGVQATGQSPDPDGNGMLTSFSNIDNDGGPLSSSFTAENQLYNYELSAPGAGIMSTVPNGGYRQYNGTSMATPLVAGGIASLLQRRSYPTWEVMWGDLINYNTEFMPVDLWAVYNADSIAPANLQCVSIEVNDTAYGDSSMYADAGERVQLYPTIRTVWGPADSIYTWLEFQEFEDTNTIEMLSGKVPFVWPLSSYAHSKSQNPIDIRIAPTVVDGRRIRLTLCAASTDAADTMRHDFTLQVTNGVKLHGMIQGNYTLYPNVHYIVTNNVALPSGDTLFIKPGTTVKIKDGCSINATIMAIGKPDSMITFTKTDLGINWKQIVTSNSRFEYCRFEYQSRYYYMIESANSQSTIVDNCIITNRSGDYIFNKLMSPAACYRTNITQIEIGDYVKFTTNGIRNFMYNNVIFNTNSRQDRGIFDLWQPEGHVFFGDFYSHGPYFCNNICSNIGLTFSSNSSTVQIITPDTNYYGSAREDVIRRSVYDFETPGAQYFSKLDFSKRAMRPFKEAHGMVWKVLVNGFDPQDEPDSVEYLGVGTHRFDVYFNRAMDTNITPILAMGVRPPYTQTPIKRNASWSADSTIYTAYLTLTGRDAIDGVNRIYVSGAKDNEHFDIPVENQRFEVQVASGGSMSAGFQATPGIGKVDLEWNDQEVNYEDFLGFNLYRYQYDSVLTNRHYVSGTGYVYDTVWMPVDTLRLNQTLVQDTMFTDFDVVPGERYYYYYKILSTSLTENSPSKTVSCVPHSTIRGDANGSYAVDVADVIATINYVTGQNPQPFLFEAADVNSDSIINVLDIVSIINIILHPDQQVGSMALDEPQTAIYTVENDTLYVSTPVGLAGLQFTIAGCERSEVEVLEALRGFECATVNEDGNLTMVFYSMSGAIVPTGKTALLRMGGKSLSTIVLSNPAGQNVIPLCGNTEGIVDLDAVQAQFATAWPNPFSGKVTLELTVGYYSEATVRFTDITGKTVDQRSIAVPTAGRYTMTWNASGLPRGIYFATLYADGQKAQTIKLVVK